MLQKTYSVYSDDALNQQLFIELGKKHVACWCKKTDDNKFNAFEFFQCDTYDASDFDSLINDIKLNSKLFALDVYKTDVLWNTTETLTVPALYNEEDLLHNNFCLIEGCTTKGKLFIKQFNDVSVITRIDNYLFTVAQKIFNQASFNGSLYLNKIEQQNAAYLFFYPNYFSFIVYKNETLLFIQTKQYSNADDVLYFIMNVFHQYNIQKDIDVITGGFINADSNLFQTLYQYVENLKLGEVDESLFASPHFKEYPSHYFLPYVNFLS